MNTGHPDVGRKLVEAWKALFVAVWNLRGRTSISFFNGALFADLQRFAQPVFSGRMLREDSRRDLLHRLGKVTAVGLSTSMLGLGTSNRQSGRLEIVVTHRKQTGGARFNRQLSRASCPGFFPPFGIITPSRGLQLTSYYSPITTHSLAAICSPVESDIMNLQLWPES